ncbi:hypothetical protein [Corynebacterium parakroppenstedtii]|uniref:hypothetical protein n=1 Tax=Corynebacterium parakroppenstedtii TaxID=2828363 RepID=UPI0030EB5BA7
MMSENFDNNGSQNVDFSALHEDSRTEEFRRPVPKDQQDSPENTPEEIPEPAPEERPLFSRGLGRAIGAGAVMVGISALVMAGASVHYVTHRSDNADVVAVSDEGDGNGTSVKAGKRVPASTAKSGQKTTKSTSGKGAVAGGSGGNVAAGGEKSSGNSGSSSGSGGSSSGGGQVQGGGDSAQPADSDDQGGSDDSADASGPEWVDGVLVLRMAEPTVEDFAAQFTYLIDPNTSDAGIKANMDAGAATVPAGRLLQKSVQMNRTNNWQWSFRGPVTVDGDLATVHFVNSANGWPETDKELVFKKVDGNWKYSRETICSYLAASGGAARCKG